MVNLSECKFGDRLKMRNGDMAIFVGRNPKYNGYDIVKQDDMMPTEYSIMPYEENGDNMHGDLHQYDIIGKWEGEIEKPATPYEIKPDMPKAIKPIKSVSEAMVEQWLQDNKHLK